MLGNFTYHNPTKLYFGEDALNGLAEELKMTGSTVMLTYGGGSIKRNGIYDSVIELLKKQEKLLWKMQESCRIQHWKSCTRAYK